MGAEKIRNPKSEIANLVVDVGNTRTKVGLFFKKKMVGQAVFQNRSFAMDAFEKWLESFDLALVTRLSSLFSTVAEPNDELTDFLKKKSQSFFELNHQMPLPFRLGYRTPETLGRDRIAAIGGAHALFSGKNCLVIDCGTCLKYDLLSADGCFEGGNIAPGAAMRLDAMAHFTARLPRPAMELPEKTMGFSTETALQNGALFGSAAEMEGIIFEFRQNWPRLKVILTGGDAPFFEPVLTRILTRRQPSVKIQLEPDLVLIGLNHILNFNKKIMNHE